MKCLSSGWLRVLLIVVAVWLLAQMPAPAQNITIYPNITYAMVDNTPLLLDLYLPQGTTGKVPVVLAIHGGSWISGVRSDLRPYAEALAAHGIAVVTPDYRLAPRFPYPAALEDMRQVARWVAAHAQDYHFDMAHYHLLGFSAGAYLAAMLGVMPGDHAPKVASVIAFSAPLDFTAPVPSERAKLIVQAFLGAERDTQPALYKLASPITHVSAKSPPFLLVHGTNDSLVPYAQATSMAAALHKAKVRCVLHPCRDGPRTAPPEHSRRWGDVESGT